MPIDRPSGGIDEPGEHEETHRPRSLDRLFGPPAADYDPTFMPVDKDGKPEQNVGYRMWYRDHGADHPDAPAPRDITPMNPMERRGPDPPIAGVLTKPADSALKDAERVWEGMSGKEGPAEQLGWEGLRMPRDRLRAMTHLEAHAAAVMRMEEMEEAVLYLSQRPCPYDRLPEGAESYKPADFPFSCDQLLPDMLPPGVKLTVYGLADGGRCITAWRTKDDEEARVRADLWHVARISREHG